MIQQLTEKLVSMGQVLLALDTGVGLLVAVGFGSLRPPESQRGHG